MTCRVLLNHYNWMVITQLFQDLVIAQDKANIEHISIKVVNDLSVDTNNKANSNVNNTTSKMLIGNENKIMKIQIIIVQNIISKDLQTF